MDPIIIDAYASLSDCACGRELNLVRDECTEPVVRENLELQERLIAAEQGRAQLEDKLTLTRSEVRLFVQVLLCYFGVLFVFSSFFA